MKAAPSPRKVERRERIAMEEIECTRCGNRREGLAKAPLRTELGERIHSSICRVCWGEWLGYQQALINHYGLDVREREARDFLTQNMEAFLFRTGEAEEIDTTQEGNISW
jgi:Fe-S cluster biosynthesis and repair protein YggX